VNFDELMCRLREEDVLLSAEGEVLRFDARAGVIGDALLDAMREHKPRLLTAAAMTPRVVASGPCTWTQNYVIARHLASKNPRTLNVATRLDIDGPLDLAALNTAWTYICGRHDVLHTRFQRYADRFVQETLDAVPEPISVHDLGLSAPEDPGDALDRWCDDLAGRPFEIDEGFLIRAELARVDDLRWVLVIVQHHLLTDAVSLGILLSELAAFYADAVAGRTPSPPPTPMRIVDYARWEPTQLDERNLDRLLDYWRDRLDGAPFDVPLPGDLPRPDRLSGQGAIEGARVSRALTERLSAFARQEGVTLFAVLLAAYARLLTDLVGRDEVVVATNSANRTRKELESLVGFLTTSIPLRLTSPRRASVREAVLLAARTAVGAQDHQAMSTPRLIELLKIRERRGAEHFPQTFFVMNPPLTTSLEASGLAARVSDLVIQGARSDFGIAVLPDGDGLDVVAELSTDFLSVGTVRGWLRRYVELLERLLDDPEREVAEW
jgi:hypothetical protein